MNACNTEVLITVILPLREQAAKFDLKLGWLATLEMWCEQAEMVEVYLSGLTKERSLLRGTRSCSTPSPTAGRLLASWRMSLRPGSGDWSDAQMEDRERLVVSADE